VDFGVFTKKTWDYGDDEQGAYKNDSKPFLFSLYSKEKYPVKKAKNAIFCCRQRGPSFGYDIIIDNQPHLDNAFNFCTFPNSYNAKHDKNSTNTPCLFKPNDGIKFHINYIKVFQILGF
jgi:hypothetical protein